MIKKNLLSLSQRNKRIIQVVTDICLVWLSLFLAFVVRLGYEPALFAVKLHGWVFIVAPIIAVLVFIPMGMYRAVVRYLGSDALITIAKAVTVSALFMALAIYWYSAQIRMTMPRSFVLIYWLFSLITMGGLRLLMRQYFAGNWLSAGHSIVSFIKPIDNKPRVAIYGAGSAGNQLLAALRMGHVMEPVAFLDDDESITHRTIGGIRVYSPNSIKKMLHETGATQVLLAVPSATRARRKEILDYLAPYPVHVRSIPGFMDLASGRVKVQDLQEVDIADLLGREEVTPNQELFQRCIKDQVVMVTGAGGSIGSELCRQIVGSGATSLVLYEHSEFNLYAIQNELQKYVVDHALAIKIIPILGSIRNFGRLLEVMKTFGVNTVYHAAAYKHVPMVEMNVVEGVVNNVYGTLNTAQAAIVSGVDNFVLISTDKAVRPTNIMGSTKRLAEMVLQALSNTNSDDIKLFQRFEDQSFVNKTRFTMVRFGNVLGSSGSVIPLFRNQIKNGGPVTVTHPNITRYFMTIPEAAQLVIQAGSMGAGGDVFVLDMGESVKIVDLAHKMINLTGLTVRNDANPNGDIDIEFTGLRPGEKLYEELLIGDNVIPTKHPKIMCANEDYIKWDELKNYLDKLQQLAKTEDCVKIRMLLREIVEGYQPQGDVVDLVFNSKNNININ